MVFNAFPSIKSLAAKLTAAAAPPAPPPIMTPVGPRDGDPCDGGTRSDPWQGTWMKGTCWPNVSAAVVPPPVKPAAQPVVYEKPRLAPEPTVSAAVVPAPAWQAPNFAPFPAGGVAPPLAPEAPKIAVAPTASGGAQLVALPGAAPATVKSGWSPLQIAVAIGGTLGAIGLGILIYRRARGR